MAWTLIALVGFDAQAQSARVGHIDEVRGVASGESCRRTEALPGSRQSLSVIRGGSEKRAWPQDSVFLLDRMRVRRLTDVRVRVDSGRFGDGTFFLAPELGRCGEAANALRVRGIELTGNAEGSYELASRREGTGPRPTEWLIFAVNNGGAYIQWSRGPLIVVALGREISVTGTEFAVLTDSARNRALLYVRDGTVAFAGAGALQAAAFTFGREGQPERFALEESVINDAIYHSRVIWTQPIRAAAPRPRGRGRLWGALGAAAVAGGVTYWVIDRREPRDEPRRGPYKGDIVIRLPL